MNVLPLQICAIVFLLASCIGSAIPFVTYAKKARNHKNPPGLFITVDSNLNNISAQQSLFYAITIDAIPEREELLNWTKDHQADILDLGVEGQTAEGHMVETGAEAGIGVPIALLDQDDEGESLMDFGDDESDDFMNADNSEGGVA
jgi:hypothetical protein